MTTTKCKKPNTCSEYVAESGILNPSQELPSGRSTPTSNPPKKLCAFKENRVQRLFKKPTVPKFSLKAQSRNPETVELPNLAADLQPTPRELQAQINAVDQQMTDQPKTVLSRLHQHERSVAEALASLNESFTSGPIFFSEYWRRESQINRSSVTNRAAFA